MRIAVLLMIALPTVSGAANGRHAECVAMVDNAYKGLTLLRGNDADARELLFDAVRDGRLPVEKKDARDRGLEAATDAVNRYIDALSEVCEAIRTP